MSRPLHHEQGPPRKLHRFQRPAGDVGRSRQGDAVVNVTSIIESAILPEWPGMRIAAVVWTGKHVIVRRGGSGEPRILFDLLLVPPPKIAGLAADNAGQHLSIVFGVKQYSPGDLLEVSEAQTQTRLSSDGCERGDEQGGQGRNRRQGEQQVSPGEGVTMAAPRLGARRLLQAGPVHRAAAMGDGSAERSDAVTLIYSWSNDSAGLEFRESPALRRLTTAACSSC